MEKWRDPLIDPYNIKFKNISIESIIDYLPAGNDVMECLVSYNGTLINCILKIERSSLRKNISFIKYH